VLSALALLSQLNAVHTGVHVFPSPLEA
jgi:hypothetical protein